MRRLFDVLILGATGFTGQYIAKYFYKVNRNLKWAIAGRSYSKLADLKSSLQLDDTSNPLPDMIIIDIQDYMGLVECLSTCRLVLNCTGPYRFLGFNVVRACMESMTDYMDICGEPQFMEKCFLDYHDICEEKGILVISACAFDSVPADLGFLFMTRQFPQNSCSVIESFLEINCPDGLTLHSTTFECAVHGFGDSQELKKIREDIKTKYHPPDIVVPQEQKIHVARGSFFEKRLEKYAVPFMGADPSVVKSSIRSISLRQPSSELSSDSSNLFFPQYAAYLTIDGWYNLASTAVYGSILSSLASFSFGRSFLTSCPEIATGGVFSQAGPSLKQMETTTFTLHFFARGKALEFSSSSEPLTVNSNNNATEVSSAIVSDVEENSNEVASATIKDSDEHQSNFSPNIPVDEEYDSLSSDEKEPPPDVVPSTPLGSNYCSIPFFNFGFGKSTEAKENFARPIDNSVSQEESSIPKKARQRKEKKNLNEDITEDATCLYGVVTGPEPGYVATPIIFVTLAICLLEERGQMPKGGVLTPASAFYDSTTVIDRLNQAGITFEIKSSSLKM